MKFQTPGLEMYLWFSIESKYTLHQEKVTFNLSISAGAPGWATLTYGLDDCVKLSWEYYVKDPIEKFLTVLSQF